MDHTPHKSTSLSFLTKGSIVEVTSDEDGFAGAWFVATVIHPPPSISSPDHHTTTTTTTNNLVYVEYNNLLTEDGSSKLREYANVAYVRPAPEPIDNRYVEFQLNDVVDAFYRDGWWTGVITKVLDTDRYIIGFKDPPSEIEFKISDIRIHRKWVAGKWVQPQNQRTAGLMFAPGKKVEVLLEGEKYRDVWVPATVQRRSGGVNNFWVAYYRPGEGEVPKEEKKLVDYLHIRPQPPHLKDKNFLLLEKVDAYYEFGWWSGVITKELPEDRYNVFFKHTKKEKEFNSWKLRPHMEWKGGKWFNTSQGDTEGRTTRSLMDTHTDQTTPATARQSTVATLINKSTEQTNLGKHSPPSQRQKDDIEVGFVDSSEKTSVPSVGQSEGFDYEASGMNDQTFGKTENLSHGKKVRSKRGKSIELETPTADSSRKRGRSANEVKSLEASGDGAKVDSVETRAPEIMDGEAKKDLTLPVVMGLQCNGMTVSQGKILQKLPSKEIPDVAEVETKQPDGPLAPLTQVNKEEKVGDAASVTPKRKRGRPPKLQAISSETRVAVDEQNGDDVGHSAVSVEDAERKDDGLPTSSGTKSSEENQEPVKEQTVLGTEQSVRKQKKYSTIKGKRGRRRTISVNAEALAQGPQDALKEKADDNLKKDSATIISDENLEKDSATRNSEASVGKSLDIMSDDQPLSRWFEGKHSPITVHGTDGSVGQPSQVSERQLEIVTFDMDADNWPFVRTTPLWQTIESLEAFRRFPQKPHFRSLLEGVKPGAREGLAIGTMVTFSTVVDKTRGLRFEDPKSTIEDCLETLVELESYGFDVEVIRERLTGLLLVKDKQEELDERSKGVEVKIEEMVQGNSAVEEIEEIDRQIRELEERRGQLLLEKENRNSEINDMQAAWEGIEEDMRKIGAEFDELASAPW
uniref:DUF724 domain-containing protein 2-like isoform X2 n=1 Tax=Erigeron canadensis TaxID=72917 RepID=UPI001CB9144A|nr:DUF724 domain-containing protein 2-like isoform X2 [Erigeron canadensis]